EPLVVRPADPRTVVRSERERRLLHAANVDGKLRKRRMWLAQREHRAVASMRLEWSDRAPHAGDREGGTHDVARRLVIRVTHAALPRLAPRDDCIRPDLSDLAGYAVRRIRRVVDPRVGEVEESHVGSPEDGSRLARVLRTTSPDLVRRQLAQRLRHLTARQEQHDDPIAARRVRGDRARTPDLIVRMRQRYEQ